jgi:hypothetical protein
VRILLCVLALATADGAMAQSPKAKGQNPQGAQQQPQPEQRGTDQAPFIVKIQQPEQAQAKSEAGSAQRPEQRGSGWLSGWTLSDQIAAIASLVAFFQFLALIGTVWVMVVNGRRQLRAYVFLESSSLTDGATLEPPNDAFVNVPGCIMQFRNSGQTPAYQVVTWAAIDVIEPINQNKLIVPKLLIVGPGYLGANGTMPKMVRLPRVLTEEEIDDIRAGRREIYVYGRIEYRDAFKRKRFSNFRLHYGGQYPPGKGFVMFICDNGNETN